MLFHLVAAILVLVGALVLRLSLHEFALLALAITLVLFAELMNTAVEVVVDLVSPDFHPLAQRAKDVAAGAVLLAMCRRNGAWLPGSVEVLLYGRGECQSGVHALNR